MELINKIKQFTIKNLNLVCTIIFFSILGYGYFITNWAISIDSEFHTFANNLGVEWIKQGRFFIPILNYIDDFHIIPFWDDLIAVLLLIISSLIWIIALETNTHNSYYISLIFALLFVISPIYSFYLRFTTYNISIGVGILFMSLVAYYLMEYFSKNGNRKINLLLSFVYLFLAVCTYQMFVIYYVSVLLLVVLSHILGNDSSVKSLRSIVSKLFIGFFILFVALFAYKLMSIVVYHFIPASDYTSNFIQWGKADFHSVILCLKAYFQVIFLIQKFNFFISFTIVCTLLFIIYLPLIDRRNVPIAILALLFLISPFTMPIAFGTAMALRTLQPVPVMLAGMWVLFCYVFNNYKVSRILMCIIVVSSFFNAQYINRLFYGDYMRLEYDKNFANQLYSYVVSASGDSIYDKPLIILGKHSYPNSPLILKSEFDTIGYSFFEWDNGNPRRMYSFMNWLGYHYIFPTHLEQESAVNLSFVMPNYPAKGSLKETESFIILKLSTANIGLDQQPINLNLKHYVKLPETYMMSNVESIINKNSQLNYCGWAYIKDFDASKTTVFIKFKNANDIYTFPVNITERLDVANAYKDGENLKNSGFEGRLNNKMKHGDYRVFLILINGNNYLEKDTDKNIAL